jgi:hypothetical protein
VLDSNLELLIKQKNTFTTSTKYSSLNKWYLVTYICNLFFFEKVKKALLIKKPQVQGVLGVGGRITRRIRVPWRTKDNNTNQYSKNSSTLQMHSYMMHLRLAIIYTNQNMQKTSIFIPHLCNILIQKCKMWKLIFCHRESQLCDVINFFRPSSMLQKKTQG